MGSYCEKDVDCRRLLQLAHFGEKFNSSTCQKTCDNCLKITSFIENDVREIAKQLGVAYDIPVIQICHHKQVGQPQDLKKLQPQASSNIEYSFYLFSAFAY
ncbi:ATP-dependent DNA helicase Q-like 4B [Glycine soja]|uniref:ATP-dependent DNA helicase Q-like 4B n=1 Tax=Glycine soja TaxID=3848 RepID=A0A0B2QFV0_GLYSO|nr:ATP-dependent DNA helicase Q-like 4B [Glycine soja]